MTDTTIRVVVVCAQRLMRDALEAMLSSNFQVVGQADITDVVDTVQRVRPTVLVIDIPTSNARAIDTIAPLAVAFPGLRITAITEHYDQPLVDILLKQGVSGYVLKSDPGTELFRAINVITQQKIFFSPEVATEIALRRGVPDAERKPAAHVLGARERQVLVQIAEGRRSQQIAVRLHVSVATVDVHRRNIMRKLNLHSVAELTKYAIREQLIRLD